MLFESVFQRWGRAIRLWWVDMDWNVFWGWGLIILGILCVALLITFTQFKRKERDSVKFSAIMVVIASLLFGFGLHMILIGRGFW